jgi:transketolase
METDHGHIAPALSCVEILVAIYYKLKRDDDIVVLSKGHAALAQYGILVDQGLIDRSAVSGRIPLPGCLQRNPEIGIEVSTGSLGHGLPIACGLAYAAAVEQSGRHVWSVVGDGELNEGSCFEAIDFSGDLGRGQHTVVVDMNGLMAMGPASGGLWAHHRRQYINGHRFGELLVALRGKVDEIVFAKTVKGKGVPFMENKPEFHFRPFSCLTNEQQSWIRSYVNSNATNGAT